MTLKSFGLHMYALVPQQICKSTSSSKEFERGPFASSCGVGAKICDMSLFSTSSWTKALTSLELFDVGCNLVIGYYQPINRVDTSASIEVVMLGMDQRFSILGSHAHMLVLGYVMYFATCPSIYFYTFEHARGTPWETAHHVSPLLSLTKLCHP